MAIGPTAPAVAGARNPGPSCWAVEAYAAARSAGSNEQRRRETDEALGGDVPISETVRAQIRDRRGMPGGVPRGFSIDFISRVHVDPSGSGCDHLSRGSA